MSKLKEIAVILASPLPNAVKVEAIKQVVDREDAPKSEKFGKKVLRIDVRDDGDQVQVSLQPTARTEPAHCVAVCKSIKDYTTSRITGQSATPGIDILLDAIAKARAK